MGDERLERAVSDAQRDDDRRGAAAQPVIIVICIALLAGINVVFNDYIVRVISTIFIFMILAVSYNLINGVTGQLSLEPNGFVAVGAYVTALLILSATAR